MGLVSSVFYLKDSWDVDYLDWQINVGRDRAHGDWHIVGWCMGIYLIKETAWNPELVNDDQTVAELWASIMDDSPETVVERIAEPLRDLGLSVIFLSGEDCEFMRRYLQTGLPSGISPQ